ncbi:MAG TPA: hypothetical protein VES67_20335 [Vicinamibacterales bacterium]|nr:hypothetical protein [Vicinamibacterales bacterium]
MLAEATEQSGRRMFFRHGQPGHDLAKPVDVGWEYLIDQRSPLGRQFAKDHALVFGAGSPAHQPTFFKFLDDVGGARTRDENSIPNLAEWERPLVIQHLEHSELGHPEAALNKVWPHALFSRLVRASQGDHQLQCRNPIGIRAPFRVF